MVNIIPKISTHRTAVARAIVKLGSEKTMEAVLGNKIAKGNVFEMAKAAGLLAVKKTSDVIPDCHPMPIEFTSISYSTHEITIEIRVEVQTIYKTGVEVEAMYGASVVAITMYDMLKPIDKQVSIEQIALVEKNGGKSDFARDSGKGLKSAVMVVSEAVFKGAKPDAAGQYVLRKLELCEVENVSYDIFPHSDQPLESKIKQLVHEVDLIVICGGTGISAKDKTPELVRSIIDLEIPGIMEGARAYGQMRTPYSMLSRGLAGVMNGKLILVIPGSTNGAKETMDALFPYVLHAFLMLKRK